MRLSKKGMYALRVLPHLAEAFRNGRRALSVAELARRESVPPKYLEQILLTLRKQGILVSERGKEGGYALRNAPEQITLGDIIRAVDGRLAPIPCASRTAPADSDPDCPYPFETCWIRHLMIRVRDNISSVLDRENLAEMTLQSEESRKGRKGNRGGH